MAIYAHTQSLNIHKKQMITVAKDLCYGQDVVNAIKAATSVQQITNILNKARRNGMDRDNNVLFSIISKCLILIKKRYGRDINLDTIPTDDEAVYKLIMTDTGSDVFALDYAKYAKPKYEICPTEIRHIEAMHAIIHRWMYEKYCQYVENKHNRENIEYRSDVEECVLAETYGVLLYVEQLVEIINSYSGIPIEVSATIAKYIRKGMQPELSVWKSVFNVGTQQNGFTQEQAQQIWEWLKIEGEMTTYRDIAAIAALTTYQCYWLKTYYPNEYKDALANHSV